MKILAQTTADVVSGESWDHYWFVGGVTDPELARSFIEKHHAAQTGADVSGFEFHCSPHVRAFDPVNKIAVIVQHGGVD